MFCSVSERYRTAKLTVQKAPHSHTAGALCVGCNTAEAALYLSVSGQNGSVLTIFRHIMPAPASYRLNLLKLQHLIYVFNHIMVTYYGNIICNENNNNILFHAPHAETQTTDTWIIISFTYCSFLIQFRA